MRRNKLFPLVLITIVTCLIFFKIFLRGLFPIPGDLLVSFYFPWYSGGWVGYNSFTTHKELLNADAIRQIYLWKEFAANEFKSGRLPLWNPYSFSGQPLAANFQSSVYYPLNAFYFLTDARNAWILLVITQPLLGGLFMYLASRSFKLSKVTSTFTAVAFMFSSYLITWMENVNVGHSYIWLPLVFWAVNNFFEKQNFRYVLVLILSLALAILGGHPQTAIYIYAVTSILFLYKTLSSKSKNKNSVIILVFAFLISLGIAAIQLIPTYELYKISPISLPFAKEVFDRSILPPQNLITFFASDFFGHPANNNFWAFSYGDFTPYFGVVPLMFALWAGYNRRKDKLVRFLTIIAGFFILAAVQGPLTFIIKILKLPIIDATTPSRFISIAIFLLIVLAGFGLEDFLKNFKDKKYLKKFSAFLIVIGLIYLSFWVFAILGPKYLMPEETWTANLHVTRRNLVLPTGMFLFLPAFVLFLKINTGKIPTDQVKNIFITLVFIVTLVGGLYYTNKFLPVSPKTFIFPDHPLFTWLNRNAALDRFYGGGTAHIDFNFPIHYKIFGAEGYDTLRLERYAQLLASGFSGNVPQFYLRSDGVFSNEENRFRKRLFELMGVKYLLDKEDSPKNDHDWHYERFQGDDVKGFQQMGKFQVYTRAEVLPRIFQTTKFQVVKDPKAIIQKIYDTNYDLQTLLLEEEPNIKIDTQQNTEIIQPKILEYLPDKVSVATTANYNSLLFISDAFEKNWNAYIDGQKVPIIRTHYAFRSIAVPAGNHSMIFKYEPGSFNTGMHITVFSILVLITSVAVAKNKKKF